MKLKINFYWWEINLYDKIWDATKDKLGIKFDSEPVYEHKYLNTR